MTRLFFCLALLLNALPASAAAGLADLGIVDRVIVDKDTGQATLVMLLDRALEDPETAKRAKLKLLNYQRFVISLELYARFPKAKQALPVQILFFHFPPQGPKGVEALRDIESSTLNLRFRPAFRQLGSKEPLALPVLGASAATAK
jgi:hypothetical protein